MKNQHHTDHKQQCFFFQVTRPLTMKKDGIQTRKRKPKSNSGGGGGGGRSTVKGTPPVTSSQSLPPPTVPSPNVTIEAAARFATDMLVDPIGKILLYLRLAPKSIAR